MKEWIITEFEKHNYTVEDDYDLCNDGIGSYEYWGSKCFDGGSNYISGTVSLFIIGEESTENIENFIDLYEDDIKEALLPKVEYDNFTNFEPINFIIKDGKIEIYIDYESEPEDRDC